MQDGARQPVVPPVAQPPGTTENREKETHTTHSFSPSTSHVSRSTPIPVPVCLGRRSQSVAAAPSPSGSPRDTPTKGHTHQHITTLSTSLPTIHTFRKYKPVENGVICVKLYLHSRERRRGCLNRWSPGFHVTYFMDTTHWSVGKGVNIVHCYQLVGVVSLTCVGSDRWGCGDSGRV